MALGSVTLWQVHCSRAWPGTLSPVPDGPGNPITWPRSLSLCSAESVHTLLGCSKAKQISVAVVTSHGRLLSFVTLHWTSSSTDLGWNPLQTVIAALTAPAESVARYQKHSEDLLFHRTICWSKHEPGKITTFQLWVLGYWRVFQCLTQWNVLILTYISYFKCWDCSTGFYFLGLFWIVFEEILNRN